MGDKNEWSVLTGSFCSGKTTLINELQKLGHQVVDEAAAILIDEAKKLGRTLEEIRSDELAFSRAVADYKLKSERALDPGLRHILDRGLHDTVAHMRLCGYELHKLEPEFLKALHDTKYKNVFLLDPLPVIVRDGRRPDFETPELSRQWHKLLHEAYTEYGMPPIVVPVMPVPQRLEFILQHLAATRAS